MTGRLIGDEVAVGDLLQESELPRHEAMRLVELASGGSCPDFYLGRLVEREVAVAFRLLAASRKRGVPLQYLEGTVQFGPVELRVDPRALIPRPETEQLWELAIEVMGGFIPRVIVDLCTGSGNLALALAHRFPQAEVYGTELSPDALALARENGRELGIKVIWLEGDLFSSLPPRLVRNVDLIVANPPYVSATEWSALPVDVREHEPEMALVAGPTGDEILTRISQEARRWLSPGGFIVCEIAEQRAAQAVSIFQPFGGIVRRDMAGRPRFTVGSVQP